MPVSFYDVEETALYVDIAHLLTGVGTLETAIFKYDYVFLLYCLAASISLSVSRYLIVYKSHPVVYYWLLSVTRPYLEVFKIWFGTLGTVGTWPERLGHAERHNVVPQYSDAYWLDSWHI